MIILPDFAVFFYYHAVTCKMACNPDFFAQSNCRSGKNDNSLMKISIWLSLFLQLYFLIGFHSLIYLSLPQSHCNKRDNDQWINDAHGAISNHVARMDYILPIL